MTVKTPVASINLILFDFGGVLAEMRNERFFEAIHSLSGIKSDLDPEKMGGGFFQQIIAPAKGIKNEFAENKNLLTNYECGVGRNNIHEEAFTRKICDMYGIDYDKHGKEVSNAFGKVIPTWDEMMQYESFQTFMGLAQQRQEDSNAPDVAIVTDTVRPHYQELLSRFQDNAPDLVQAHHILASCRSFIQHRKSTPRFAFYALRGLGRVDIEGSHPSSDHVKLHNPKQILAIDDRPYAIEMWDELGVSTLQYKLPKEEGTQHIPLAQHLNELGIFTPEYQFTKTQPPHNQQGLRA